MAMIELGQRVYEKCCEGLLFDYYVQPDLPAIPFYLLSAETNMMTVVAKVFEHLQMRTLEGYRCV